MRRFIIGMAAGAVAACGGDDTPADVAGTYTIAVTSRENGCGIEGWVEGSTLRDIHFTVMQSDASVTGEVDGFAGTFLEIALGSRTFEGTVSGDTVSMRLHGQRSYRHDRCTYQFNGSLEATVSGDFIQGGVAYRPATNGSPDCGALESCVSAQAFNGSRPPP